MTGIEREYDLAEVCDLIQMSPRWIRDRIRLDKVEHQRYGNRIRFTEAQVEALRARHAQNTKAPEATAPVTTGRKKRSA